MNTEYKNKVESAIRYIRLDGCFMPDITPRGIFFYNPVDAGWFAGEVGVFPDMWQMEHSKRMIFKFPPIK